MKISILTLFPELYSPFVSTSLVKRACELGTVQIDVRSLFSFCAPKERADGPIFGHGPGLLVRPEVVERAVDAQEGAHGPAFKVFFSPHGRKLDQSFLHEIYGKITDRGSHVMVLPARYEGMDARIEEEYADAIISIGDYVLMGGDLPAMVFLEGLLRFVPGVVGRQESVEEDSFTGPFTDYPHYTAPVVWKGHEVPEVVRSGNHAAQREWQHERAAERTTRDHFDWVRSFALSDGDKKLVRKNIPPHYVALMHTDVLVQKTVEGNSSVTSIDIHDIARSSTTFGFKNYFVVTPLADQQKIVETLLGFWQEGEGVTYNPSRHRAVSSACWAKDFDDVVAQIEMAEGKKPIVVATSARRLAGKKNITYDDQGLVWGHERPVLFLFGTANGLAPTLVDRCDYVLDPIEGLSSFNHLSVRSAAAIVFDRWLGLQVRRRDIV